MRTTDPVRVLALVDDPAPPRHGATVSGYGRNLPTRARLRYVGDDGRARWHRVRVMSYGNAGSAYIRAGGSELFLDTDTEYLTRLDARYSVAREGAGDPSRPFVARYLGDFLATVPSERAAWSVARFHREETRP
jgi:hypothetical protein